MEKKEEITEEVKISKEDFNKTLKQYEIKKRLLLINQLMLYI